MKVYIEYDIPEATEIELKDITHTTYKNLFVKLKYKIMWQLRSLEREIADEGGIIIIKPNGSIETKNFTPELTENIRDLLSNLPDD